MSILTNLAVHTPASPDTLNPRCPAALSQLVMRLLEKRPADRPASAQAVLDAIVEIERRTPGDDNTTLELESPPAPKSLASKMQPGLAQTQVTTTGFSQPPASKWRAALAVSCAALVLLAAVAVYRIQTDRGTLVVTLVDPQVQAILETDGLVVRDKEPGRSWKITTAESKSLPSGTYELTSPPRMQLTITDDNGAEMNGNEFSLKRKGAVRVHVKLEQAPEVAGSSPAVTDPERRAAEWVLSVGGIIRTNGNPVVSMNELPPRPIEIATVELANNQDITDDSLKILQPCTKLSALLLGNVPIGDEGMVHFRGHRLKVLWLNKTRVTDKGLAQFAECQDLRILNLRDSLVTDAGLVAFQHVEQLRELLLGGAQISDAGLAHFKRCRKLERLDVSRTNVTHAGLTNFDGNDRLIELNLGSTGVTDVGLAPFKNCTNLNTVILSDTRVGDDGLAYLKDCREITDLRLLNTKVSDVGLTHSRNCRNLRRLELTSTRVSDAGVELFRDFQNLQQLGLSYLSVTDASVAVLKDRPRLKFLTLAGNERVSEAGFEQLQHCRRLKRLTLNNTNLTDRQLTVFGEDLQLATLHIRGTKVSADGVKRFSERCPGCRVEWDGGVIEPRPQNTPDRRGAEWVLSLGGHIAITSNADDVTFQPGNKLPPENFELHQVHLEENEKVTDAGLKNLTGCRELTSLDLPNITVSDAGIAHLDAMDNLLSLDLSGTRITDGALSRFRVCNRLTSLRLSSTLITDAGLSHLREGLAEHHSPDEIFESAFVSRQVFHDAVDYGSVGQRRLPAKGVGDEFFRERSSELLVTCNEQAAEVGDAGELFAGGEHAAGVDLLIFRVVRTPAADGVEVLQRKTVGVNLAMTRGRIKPASSGQPSGRT